MDTDSEVSAMLAYERHRITLDEYHRMVDAGVFPDDSRVELIEGELLEPVSPIGKPHSVAVSRIHETLIYALNRRAVIRSQSPVTLPDNSEPQPDIAVARLRDLDYLDQHPLPEDLLLVIEVSDTSREFDRQRKIPLYGRCGVPEAWVVDVIDRVVYVSREPCRTGYAVTTIARPGEHLIPLAFPEQSIAVDDMLPPGMKQSI